MFGKGINSNEFPCGVFESNGDLSPVSLRIIELYLAGRCMHAPN